MSSFLSQRLLAEPSIQIEDAPTWAPILFAVGAFCVVALVLVVMWKKLKQSDQWRGHQDTESRRDDDFGDDQNQH